MASQEMWKYADDRSKETSDWAIRMAKTYHTYIGVGYLDKENGDYFNRYLIAGPDGICGTVSKSEGESAVFKRGDFGNVIHTPFGTVGVAICYDSRRRHFYDNVKDEKLSLILFPHGAPADPNKPEKEQNENDKRCLLYADAFGVPVVYGNSKGFISERCQALAGGENVVEASGQARIAYPAYADGPQSTITQLSKEVTLVRLNSPEAFVKYRDSMSTEKKGRQNGMSR